MRACSSTSSPSGPAMCGVSMRWPSGCRCSGIIPPFVHWSPEEERAMKAADMMTSNLITIGPDASVRDAAWTMLTYRISAVPVVDGAGKLVGIVSEGDLLHRVEAGTERLRSWWYRFNASAEALATDFVKSHSRKVCDVMTRELVTVGPDT